MRIVTNPGSNLSDVEVRRYSTYLTGQKIVVDGVQHDTRGGISLEVIDEWVRSAKVYPHVLGTSAGEFIEIFRELAPSTDEILVVSTSRRIIGSYNAALAAVKTASSTPGLQQLRVSVVDTQSTDMGAGACAMLAGEAAAARLPMARIVELLESAAVQGRMVLSVATFDNLVKGGRASFLRAWAANLFSITPLIGFVNGELSSVAKISKSADMADAMVDYLVSQLGERRAIWCGVVHGQAPGQADRLASKIEAKFNVKALWKRPLQSSIYLNVGPGAVGAFVLPIDRLPWMPPSP